MTFDDQHDSSDLASSDRPSRLNGVRVLLAEDHTTNQMLALKMLRRLGCAVEVVADGLEMLAKLDEADFDVILMDVVMPRMDGLQATKEVRRREQSQTTSRRVPIIAMTAHAMLGDRERCLAAQMDDCLGKPVTITQLTEVLERWVDLPAGKRPSPPTFREVLEPPAKPPLQLARLRELSLGDQEFEQDILECLLTDVANGMASLTGALDPLDPIQIANTLHGIVGACRTVGAEALGTLCRACEQAARQPEFLPDAVWLAAIEREQAHLITAIDAHLNR